MGKRAHRFHGFPRLPKEYGQQEIPIRLHQNADDDRRRINRTENLRRAIPEGSEDFKRLYPLRLDAESVNRGSEDSLWINRVSARGWRRQLADFLGHARMVNAITLARCRARAPAEAAA